jgi:hypothetical protein
MRHGTDHGFELVYWQLSYRQKFIRTLWVSPIILFPFLLPPDYSFIGVPIVGLLGIFLVILLVQAWDTYVKWKKEERRLDSHSTEEEPSDSKGT